MPVQTKPKPCSRINDNFLQSFSASWRAEGLAEQTLREYVRHLRGFARCLDGSFIEATRQDLEAYVTAEMGRLSPSTAAYATRALKRFYGWLTDEEDLGSNPALRLKTPKVPEPVTKIAKQENQRRRTDAAGLRSLSDRCLHALCEVALARCSGCAGTCWSDPTGTSVL